ncbi:unnamed protein product [Urochloa humidicola]
MGADAGPAGTAGEREAEIEKAMRARVPDFKKQADSLTLEGVRRALEKDLGLEIYSLDAHKKFIKQCVDKVFAESDDENTNGNASEDAEAKDDHLSKEGLDDANPMPVSNKTSSSADAQVVRSSETGNDPAGQEDKTSNSDISEAMIKEAIGKRASYFRKNSETLTLQGVRRTLEEDLKLQKKALDPHKNFITTELDKVLQEPANVAKKKSKKAPPMDTERKTSKGSKRAREDSDSSELNDSQSEMEDTDDDTGSRKKRVEKAKVIKKQKKVANEKKLSTPKAKKVAKRDSDRDEQVGNSAEEDNSRSSAEEDNKRKQQQAPVYGKQVERLKSIIKSCGMTIPPTVYRRAKQAPEHKREACLIKELEDMLEKEGLSKNPSEKEIKAVKKRKERAKELEGIDMSNIITSSRRRSTSSFIPLPPPPKIEEDSDDDEDDDAKDDDEDVEENVEGGDEGDNDDVEAGDGSADDAAKDSD